jgi:xanthine dehydrogenase accessory factor
VLVVSLSGREALVERLVEALAEPREVTLALPVDGGAPSLREREGGGTAAGGGSPTDSGWATPDERVFLRVYPVPLRLVIVGAVHIAQSLAAMARAVGFRVQVLDPRSAFATPERFPGTTLVRAWPREGWERVDPDHRTAVVTLTHDDKLDDPALEEALAGPAFYVGALGSRRTHARRRTRLLDAGLDPEEVDRIHAPVGLDIGASTPEEIALAILAEIVAVHRARRGEG